MQAAAFRGQNDIVKLLVARGGDANIQAGRYETALLVAAYYGRTEIAKLLLVGGAEIALQTRMPMIATYTPVMTALKVAVARGQIETLQLLLRYSTPPAASPLVSQSGHV